MPIYNWDNLSDHDFELVSRDVMAKLLNKQVEVFSRGPDGGIDLRVDDGPSLILGQAKHYLKSPFSKLLTAAEKEQVKIKKMKRKPTRYLLFTTQTLTPGNKDSLKTALSPHIRSTADILGVEEIEKIVRETPTIEDNNYKLWLASLKVVERVLRNAAITHSEIRISELTNRARLFVEHDAHPKAEEILKKEHNLIISGPAGIGKTTLAEMLALRFLANDFEVTFASKVSDLEERFKPGIRQMFVYDDFLGRTNLREGPPHGEQEKLFAFMRHVANARDKYLVLTTREYIYREALASNDRLMNSRSEIIKCLLDVEAYGLMSRAQILYNHLYWANGIPPEDLAEFVKTKGYQRIIRHRGFNPRFIADTINRLAPDVKPSSSGGSPWI